MKRMILLLAAAALLATLFCGCETGAGTTHTNPPKVTSNVTASPAPATPSAKPTPDATTTPDVTAAPDDNPVIPSVTDTPSATPGSLTGENGTGTNTGDGEIPQPRRGGLM